MLRAYIVPINRAGWPFIGALAVLAVVGAAYSQPFGWIGALLTAWCVYFFRDPDRVVPIREGLVVSPADGLVQTVGPAAPPPELELGDAAHNRVSIFMDVFDVHVNRVPVTGRVAASHYRPGKFVNASLDKASEGNERHSVHLVTPDGVSVGVVQIAGLVARRIVCPLVVGDQVVTGRRYGMIRFGSRLDVYLPERFSIMVSPGQHAYAGETVIADLRSEEPSRSGEIR